MASGAAFPTLGWNRVMNTRSNRHFAYVNAKLSLTLHQIWLKTAKQYSFSVTLLGCEKLRKLKCTNVYCTSKVCFISSGHSYFSFGDADDKNFSYMNRYPVFMISCFSELVWVFISKVVCRVVLSLYKRFLIIITTDLQINKSITVVSRE